MTADEARKSTKGLTQKLDEYIKNIDNAISNCCKCGCRSYEVENLLCTFADDVVKHYRDNGFKVQHIVSPYTVVTISW